MAKQIQAYLKEFHTVHVKSPEVANEATWRLDLLAYRFMHNCCDVEGAQAELEHLKKLLPDVIGHGELTESDNPDMERWFAPDWKPPTRFYRIKDFRFQQADNHILVGASRRDTMAPAFAQLRGTKSVIQKASPKNKAAFISKLPTGISSITVCPGGSDAGESEILLHTIQDGGSPKASSAAVESLFFLQTKIAMQYPVVWEARRQDTRTAVMEMLDRLRVEVSENGTNGIRIANLLRQMKGLVPWVKKVDDSANPIPSHLRESLRQLWSIRMLDGAGGWLHLAISDKDGQDAVDWLQCIDHSLNGTPLEDRAQKLKDRLLSVLDGWKQRCALAAKKPSSARVRKAVAATEAPKKPGRKSIQKEPWHEEALQLRQEGRTKKAIAERLKLNGFPVTHMDVDKLIERTRRRKRRKELKRAGQ